MWSRIAGMTIGMALLVGALAAQQAQQAQQPPAKANYQQGQIVRVDPQTSTVTVRTTNGKEKVERAYKVNNDTKYWGSDRKPFFDGLSNKGWKQGTDFWYQLGTGNEETHILDMRMYNPVEQPAPPKQ
jgi:hypothetical protein